MIRKDLLCHCVPYWSLNVFTFELISASLKCVEVVPLPDLGWSSIHKSLWQLELTNVIFNESHSVRGPDRVLWNFSVTSTCSLSDYGSKRESVLNFSCSSNYEFSNSHFIINTIYNNWCWDEEWLKLLKHLQNRLFLLLLDLVSPVSEFQRSHQTTMNGGPPTRASSFTRTSLLHRKASYEI